MVLHHLSVLRESLYIHLEYSMKLEPLPGCVVWYIISDL